MEEVIELMDQYKTEFKFDYDLLKEQIAEIKEEIHTKKRIYDQLNQLHNEIKRQSADLLVKLRDKSDLKQLDTKHLMNTFTWAGVMVAAMSLANILGGMVLDSFTENLISYSDAAITAYLIMPAVAFYCIFLFEIESKVTDIFLRHALLFVAITEGYFAGFIFAKKSLESNLPIAAITPLAAGIIPHLTAPLIANNRKKLMWLSIGGGIVAHLTVGAFLTVTATYLSLIMIYAFVGYIILQLYTNDDREKKSTHLYQMSFTYGILLADAFIYSCLGTDVEQETSTVEQTESWF